MFPAQIIEILKIVTEFPYIICLLISTGTACIFGKEDAVSLRISPIDKGKFKHNPNRALNVVTYIPSFIPLHPRGSIYPQSSRRRSPHRESEKHISQEAHPSEMFWYDQLHIRISP
jgi:hypothetical protein